MNNQVPPSTARIWLMAVRPKTLPASIAPVFIGTSMAIHDERFHMLAALAAFFGALLIQIGTNLANDYYDFVKGADTEERAGPPRVTQSGLVKPSTVYRAFLGTFGLAILIGGYLVARGGISIVIIGLSAVLFGILYTGGKRPLGYMGLGDILVLIYFGPVAVAGTYYVQGLTFNSAAVVAGLGTGLLSVALLTVNNLRDIVTDSRSGKRTLAVRFGPRYSRYQYLGAIIIALGIPIYLWWKFGAPPGVLLTVLGIIPAVPALRIVFQSKDPKRLIQALELTGKLLMVYGLGFSLGWLI